MGILDIFRNKTEVKAKANAHVTTAIVKGDDDIFKAYIPDFLYKPPYGYPRKENLPFLRKLAISPYVFSIIKTLCDEISSLDWEICSKEDVEMTPELEEKIKEIKQFFYNPNKNDQSFENVLRAVIRDILEIDAGVIVKVFDKKGKFSQMFARDGMTFLKNPNIFGYLGDREEFVMPIPSSMQSQLTDSGTTTYKLLPAETSGAVKNYYDQQYAKKAAYFQYGWTAGSMPVPFGRREIIYLMQNPRSDSPYGRSPVEVLADTIMNLMYGQQYSLDFYINGNLPEGLVSIEGVSPEELEAAKERWQDKFQIKDALGNTRRIGSKFPFTTGKASFVPFKFSTKDMEIIEQQKWYTKIVWMAFGVTPDEMGVTEESNRAVAFEQSKVFKRKALRPLTNLLAYHFTTQLIPEFFVDKFKTWEEAQDNSPLVFKFKHYDIEEDIKKHQIYQMQIAMGLKTPEMVAEEMDINVDDLLKWKEEHQKKQEEIFQNKQPEEKPKKKEEAEDKIPEERQSPEKTEKNIEKKAEKEVAQQIIDYLGDIGKELEEDSNQLV